MSDPASQHPDEELKVADDECRRIISDVLHSFSDLSVLPSDPLDEELMPVADEPLGLSDPPSKNSDEELMIVDSKNQISDQIQGSSDVPSTLPDEELMLIDDKRQMFSNQLQGSSDPPSMDLDDELVLVDDKRQVSSDQLQGFSYPLEPPSKPFDEKLMFVDLVVEEGSQVKKEEATQKITSDLPDAVVLRDVEYGELEGIMNNEETPALYFNDNVKDGMSDLPDTLSKDPLHVLSDPPESSKKVDEKGKSVSDQIHVLSDSSESSLLPDVELASQLDDGMKHLEVNDLHPGVEEVSQVKEASNVDVKPLTTLEPDEVELVPRSIDVAAEADNLDYYTFSLENHRFAIIMANSHVDPKYYLVLQRRTSSLLPPMKIPVVLNSYGKIWMTIYNGHLRVKAFEVSSWRSFAVDNKLKVGDACFFELMENSPEKIVFKVIIVRTDSSPSHAEAVDDGTSAEKAIILE